MRRFVLLLLLVAVVCQSQTKNSSASTAQGGIACGTSKGCATFNELVRSKDAQFRDLGADRIRSSIVCFDETKDSEVFSVVQFGREKTLIWFDASRNESGAVQESNDFFYFNDFRNGLSNRSEVVPILWKRLMLKDMAGRTTVDDVHAESKERADDNYVVITETSVDYGTHFKNAENQEVKYTLQIRRSTMRFGEDFSSASMTISRHGRCLSF
jgi:hypothetical protein